MSVLSDNNSTILLLDERKQEGFIVSASRVQRRFSIPLSVGAPTPWRRLLQHTPASSRCLSYRCISAAAYVAGTMQANLCKTRKDLRARFIRIAGGGSDCSIILNDESTSRLCHQGWEKTLKSISHKLDSDCSKNQPVIRKEILTPVGPICFTIRGEIRSTAQIIVHSRTIINTKVV